MTISNLRSYQRAAQHRPNALVSLARFRSNAEDDAIAGRTGRLRDRLALELGDDSIFMDADGIPLGRNFVKQITAEVQSCDALLAIIGPNWVDAHDVKGNRRLEDPRDFVRLEIGAALQRDIPVIPILINGTSIPRADRLPAELQELALRNGLDVRHASFHADVTRLVRELKKFAKFELGESQSDTAASSIKVEGAPDAHVYLQTSASPSVYGSQQIGTSASSEDREQSEGRRYTGRA